MVSEYRRALWVMSGAVLVGAVGLGFWMSTHRVIETNIVFCTQEAKVCPDGSTVERSGPRCEFALCPGLKTNTSTSVAAETFTNTELKYHLTLPEGWYVRSTSGGNRIDPASASSATMNQFSPTSQAYGNAPSIQIQGVPINSFANYPQTVVQWRSLHASSGGSTSETPLTVGNADGVLEQETTDMYGQTTNILVSRGNMFYTISAQQLNDAGTQALLKSLTFDLPAKTVTAKIPFTSIREFNATKQDFGQKDVHALSIMAGKVLIGGQSSLLGIYDLTTGAFTNLANQLPQDNRTQFRDITAVGNNGQYWLAISSGSEGVRMWKITGTTVAEIPLGKMSETGPNIPARTEALASDGTTWLFGNAGGGLFEYDGQAISDLSTDLQSIPLTADQKNITQIVPDGSGWRLLIHGQVYTYKARQLTAVQLPTGPTISRIIRDISNPSIAESAWYYLADNGEIHHQTSGASTKSTDAMIDTHQHLPQYIFNLEWVGDAWYTGQNFYDGKTVTTGLGVSVLGSGMNAVSTANDHFVVFGGQGGTLSVVAF